MPLHTDRLRSTLRRRDFLGAAGAVLAGTGLLPLVGGCGRDPAARAGRRGAPRELGAIERELNVYNWSEYIAEDTIPAFEREFGVRVTYDTYESAEEMLAKLQAGATGYDVVVPNDAIGEVMVASGLAEPLDRAYLPNLANVADIFTGGPVNADGLHAVPYQWGVTGIAWRKDRMPAPDSWGVFLDPKFAGRMTMLDDGREVLGAFLRYRGRSLNSTDPAELEAARADAIAAKANLKAYISAPVKGQIVAGDVWLAQMWSVDANQARMESPEIGFVIPREGSLLYVDYLMMPAGAPHPRAAHEFMNYLQRPEVAAALADFTGGGTTNAAALELLEVPKPFPTADELARLEQLRDLGRATELYDRLWTEIKAA